MTRNLGRCSKFVWHTWKRCSWFMVECVEQKLTPLLVPRIFYQSLTRLASLSFYLFLLCSFLSYLTTLRTSPCVMYRVIRSNHHRIIFFFFIHTKIETHWNPKYINLFLHSHFSLLFIHSLCFFKFCLWVNNFNKNNSLYVSIWLDFY